jgi:predicted O-methyltransferase YrrM
MVLDLSSIDDQSILIEAARRLGLPYELGSYYLPLVRPDYVKENEVDQNLVVDPENFFNRATINDFSNTIQPYYCQDLPDYSDVAALQLGLGYNPIAAHLYYQVVKAWNPEVIIEVGAGTSTFYAHRALNGSGQIVCVEPFPSPALKAWCPANNVELRELKLQEAISGLDFSGRTLLFVDSTHVCSISSELHRIFIDILPKLSSGSLIHFDDIFLPYPCLHSDHNSFAGTVNWYESSLLGIFLSSSSEYETVFPQYWMGRNDVLRASMEHALPLYKSTHWEGGAYWIRKL